MKNCWASLQTKIAFENVDEQKENLRGNVHNLKSIQNHNLPATTISWAYTFNLKNLDQNPVELSL